MTVQSITGIRLASAQFLNDFHEMGRSSQIFVAFILAVAVLVSATVQSASALTKAVAAAMKIAPKIRLATQPLFPCFVAPLSRSGSRHRFRRQVSAQPLSRF
jgi:hypothetical protein